MIFRPHVEIGYTTVYIKRQQISSYLRTVSVAVAVTSEQLGAGNG